MLLPTPVDTTRCRDHLRPITQMWSDLRTASTTPNIVWFEPDACNTMHNCSVATGETWMRNNIPTILNSPAFTRQRSLPITTWDEEDNWTSANPIPTIVVGSPGVTKTGFTSNTGYDHYSVPDDPGRARPAAQHDLERPEGHPDR